MERLTDDQKSKLDKLQTEARQAFPENALFTYTHNGEAYTLTLPEAIDVCGRHIAAVPIDGLIGMLRGMYNDATLLADYAEDRLRTSIERGRLAREQALAKQALEGYEA